MEYFWYAIYTKSRSERKLYQDLLDAGIEAYLPLKKELKTWSDRKKWVESPLFTSYVFVRVSAKEYHQALLSNYAVCYVSIRGKAVPIPEKQIEALRIFLKDENRKLEFSSADLKAGDRVEVICGSLKGATGEITQIRGRHRLVLRFDSLGTCLSTEIKIEEVKQTSI
ncbi:UpxY family transcription antiterminator [Marinifilum sp. RC60d5]|uniref:UpxY family transcription antiterminator n=1 Tax=Marinifilum sp. RC60d5 TaxID=3458414 RepID=UPI004035EDF3